LLYYVTDKLRTCSSYSTFSPELTARFLGALLLLIVLAFTPGTCLAQTTVNLFGTSTPAVADSGNT
jgi:hypothetical protein